MRIFGLTLLEMILIISLTGSVSAMGVESFYNSQQHNKLLTLRQLQFAVHSINTQVYSLALVQNLQRQPQAFIQFGETSVPVQYGFIADAQSLIAVANILNVSFDDTSIQMIQDKTIKPLTSGCALFYQAPLKFGETATITTMEDAC
ncbi:hypothetical protein [Marinicellulosiphila megalodicopiae]|uniref:hypothetical protein n=1 Tax=Marinicellulosiphila megalodicopiae TaxID=2724896 RepID=UPI003BAE7A53